VTADGATRYVAVGVAGHTVLEGIDTATGTLRATFPLLGSWGIPALGLTGSGIGLGLSQNGRTLVLGTTSVGRSSKFLVVDPRALNIRTWIVLKGSFQFDALSPDASKLYLIQHTSSLDQGRYVVRAYDLGANRLLPGRIADRTQRSWVMSGYAVTRTTSAGGRWVYTLYQNPGGTPFVHALDTVRGVAHCIGLPFEGDQTAFFNLQLDLHDGGRTLAIHWKSGRRWLNVSTTDWRLSTPRAGRGWLWLLLVGLCSAAALAAATVLVLRAGGRRRPSLWLPRLAPGRQAE
jgi:hypothetical protein